MSALSAESLTAEVESLKVNVEQLWAVVIDQQKRLSTLQSPLWKRFWFRVDGWPGQVDLNGVRRWRPWHGRR